MLFMGWSWWQDFKQERGWKEALAEKERTIQRLAKDNREMRIAMFKKLFGWTDKEVERFVIRNDFATGVEARKALEQEPDTDEGRVLAAAQNPEKEG